MAETMDKLVRQRIEVEAEVAKYLNIADTTLTEVVGNIRTANKIFIKDQRSTNKALAHQQVITPICKE